MLTSLPAGVVGYLERRRIETHSVIALTGDASDRRYFRVIPTVGTPFVLALHAVRFSADTLPQLNVAALFDAMPLPVPRILGHAEDLGVLAQEDLGDVTLQAHLGAASASEVANLYAEATDLLTTLQRRGHDLADAGFIPYTLAFDVEKLVWEMQYFVKHFVESYRGVTIPAQTRLDLLEGLTTLCTSLAAEPRVLCHRDYHSRNLMVTPRGLVIIDYQDARLGPNTYDLVSLLRDSYVDLPADLVASLMRRFHEASGREESADAFADRFDRMALQRNLKALGTFGFQTVSRGNPVYAQYVPRTLRLIRENFDRHPEWARLRALLASAIPEIG